MNAFSFRCLLGIHDWETVRVFGGYPEHKYKFSICRCRRCRKLAGKNLFKKMMYLRQAAEASLVRDYEKAVAIMLKQEDDETP